jgi:hypothetical protein
VAGRWRCDACCPSSRHSPLPCRQAHTSSIGHTRFLYALHSQFKQIPMLAGQIVYAWDTWRGYERRLIEYDAAEPV